MWSYRRQTEACSQSITAIPCHHCVSLSFSPLLRLSVRGFRSTPACFITGLLVGLIRARVTVPGPESQRVAFDRGENGLTDMRKTGFKRNLKCLSVTTETRCFYPHTQDIMFPKSHMLPSCAPLKLQRSKFQRQCWKLLTGQQKHHNSQVRITSRASILERAHRRRLEREASFKKTAFWEK